MTFEQAIAEAKQRARYFNRAMFVCYSASHPSLGWRYRYIVSGYMGMPAADPKSVKAEVSPTGKVRDMEGRAMVSKTYSVAIQNETGIWLTNWGQYFDLDDIDWAKVEEFCIEGGDLAYGYYHGHNSRNLTSKRCRTVLWKRREDD